ncbi:MAG: ankyrin repeat domain-containing protein, partial [Bacilli bacterium]
DYEMIEYLLKRGAKVNEIYYGRSYLYRAIMRNNYEIVKLLIDNGADVNYIDNRHRTIYSYALDYADDDIIELLVEKKAALV